MEEYICIGKIINTHGLRGEVKIESYSDFDAERYRKGNTVYLRRDQEYIPLVTASYRKHKGFSLVSFVSMQNINAVEAFKGLALYICTSERKPLGKGSFYRNELIGLDVYDEAHERIGEVLEIEETLGANNNVRILTEDGREVLVPYVPGFIRHIDLDENEMVIHVMEGLL